LIATPDGGYLLGGRSYNQGFEDFYLVKTDSNGTEEWQRAYDVGIQTDLLGGVAMTEDGACFIAGHSAVHAAVYAVILKVGANGDTLWSKSYGLGLFYDAVGSDSNAIVAVGMTDEFEDGGTGPYIIKVGSEGDVLWWGNYGDSGTGYIGVNGTNDGGYIAVGRIWPWAGIIVKINADGEQEWRQVFDTPESQDCFLSVEQAADGGYLVGGWNDFGSLLVKYNAEGDTLWSKVPFGASINGIVNAPGGGFTVVAGAFAIRMDDLGERLWTFSGEFNNDQERFRELTSIVRLGDNGYAFGGDRYIRWDGGFSAGLVRTLPDTVVIPFELQGVQEFHDFQRVRLDSINTWDVAVKNIGRRYAEIDSVSFKGVSPVFEGAFDQPVGIAVNDTNFVPLTFHPLADTLYSDTAQFWCGDLQVLEVYLEGRGIPGNGVGDDGLEIRPTEFGIVGCWPNPFNSTTTIRYRVPVAGKVRLTVHDVMGREVRECVSAEVRTGEHTFRLDAEGLTAGVYVVRLEGGGEVRGMKVVVVR